MLGSRRLGTERSVPIFSQALLFSWGRTLLRTGAWSEACANIEKFMIEAELIPAVVGDAGLLANLMQLYAYDFSEFHPVDIGEDGRLFVVHAPLSLYWSEAGRHPFLIRMDGSWRGWCWFRGTARCGTWRSFL